MFQVVQYTILSIVISWVWKIWLQNVLALRKCFWYRTKSFYRRIILQNKIFKYSIRLVCRWRGTAPWKVRGVLCKIIFYNQRYFDSSDGTEKFWNDIKVLYVWLDLKCYLCVWVRIEKSKQFKDSWLLWKLGNLEVARQNGSQFLIHIVYYGHICIHKK